MSRRCDRRPVRSEPPSAARSSASIYLQYEYEYKYSDGALVATVRLYTCGLIYSTRTSTRSEYSDLPVLVRVLVSARMLYCSPTTSTSIVLVRVPVRCSLRDHDGKQSGNSRLLPAAAAALGLGQG